MKLFGLYISVTDYAGLYEKKCKEVTSLEHYAARVKRESNEAHISYNTLQKQYADLSEELQDAKHTISVRDLDIKKLHSHLAEVSERLEKEMSDNCELHILYADKCKECEDLKVENNGIVMTEEEYNKLKADADKFRTDREKHNANRRKKRAAKKVAHAKPE